MRHARKAGRDDETGAVPATRFERIMAIAEEGVGTDGTFLDDDDLYDDRGLPR